mgnify:CR=1 FL=1
MAIVNVVVETLRNLVSNKLFLFHLLICDSPFLFLKYFYKKVKKSFLNQQKMLQYLNEV